MGSDQRPVDRLSVRKEDVSRLNPNGYSRAEIARLLDAADPDGLMTAADTWHAASKVLAGLHDDLRSKAEIIAVDWDGAAAATCQLALRRIAGTARQLASYAADLRDALTTAARAQQRAKEQLAAFRANPTVAGGLGLGGDGDRLLEHVPDTALAQQIDRTARQWLQGIYDGYHQAMSSLPDRIAYDLPRLSTAQPANIADSGRPDGQPQYAAASGAAVHPNGVSHDGPLGPGGGHLPGAGGDLSTTLAPGQHAVAAAGGQHSGAAASAGLAAAGHHLAEAGLAAETHGRHGASAPVGQAGHGGAERETDQHGYGRQGIPGPWVPPPGTGDPIATQVSAGAGYDGYVEAGSSLAGGIAAGGPLDPGQPVGTSWQGPGSPDLPYATAADQHRVGNDPQLPGMPADGPTVQGRPDPGVIVGTVAEAVAAAEHHHAPGDLGGPAPGDAPASSPGGPPPNAATSPSGTAPGLDAPYIAATVAAALAEANHHHGDPGAFPAPADAPPTMQDGPTAAPTTGGPQFPDARAPVTVPDDVLPDLRPGHNPRG